jgi:DNA-binding NarL/FixJ family response regulator
MMTIYIQENGEKREATEAEIAQFAIDRIQADKRQADEEAKTAARQSALAKLAALGLTEDEIAAL